MYRPYTLQDVYDAAAQKKFSVISTFAGGGGSSTGYRLAGGDILAINEFVEEARNTYRDNYPTTPIVPDDIKQLTGQSFLDLTGLQKGELDILDGSPPCSAFSVAGKLSHSKGGNHSDGWGQTKTYSDGMVVENIEDLFFEFLRVANEIQPKVIIAENVKGLTIGEAKEYYNRILNEFENIGYEVVSEVMDARYYGVSQTRSRVIFIAVRNDVAEEVGLNFLTMNHLFPTPSRNVIPLKDALVDLEYDQEEVDYLREKFERTAYWRDTGSKMKLP